MPYQPTGRPPGRPRAVVVTDTYTPLEADLAASLLAAPLLQQATSQLELQRAQQCYDEALRRVQVANTQLAVAKRRLSKAKKREELTKV
jgi:hypothetical protein